MVRTLLDILWSLGINKKRSNSVGMVSKFGDPYRIFLNLNYCQKGIENMLNFELEPCEWRKNMKIIMENIDLNKIEFRTDNSILFSFSSTCNGNEYKKFLCKNVWKFSASNNLNEEDIFPCFICDVRISELKPSEIKSTFNYLGYGFGDIPHSDKYLFVCLDSGEICIEMICSDISF